MNPRDGSPIDYRTFDYSHFLGTSVREWLDVKMLADEEGISIRGLVDQYRLLKSGERHRARRSFDYETEALRARQSLLEERVASLERRLGRLANV